jgi:stringent starvation protein B
MPTSQPLPPKKEVALALLERSNDRGIYVHLDPRRTGVTVPPWFKKQPQLVLQIGLNMAIPIPDLRLDDDGMSCTLSFSGSPFFCVVPWSGVFAIVGDDARGMVWPDDVPVEISRQTPVRAVEPARKEIKEVREPAKPEPVSDPKTDAGAKTKKPRKRPALAAVGEDAPPAPPPSKPARPAPARAPQPPVQVAPTPVVPAAPPSKPAAGAPRKKRELPPYLRVVK